MTGWTFGTKIAAGFALAFTLLVVVGAIAWTSVRSLASTSRSVEEVHVVIGELSDVISLAKDAETGQRGFIITGDEAYLEPYDTARRELPRSVDELRARTAGSATQQQRVQRISELVDERLEILERTIADRRAGTVLEVAAFIQKGDGKRVMDQLRATVAEMDREERQSLAERARDVDAAVARTNVLVPLFTGICLALVLAIGVFLTRSLTSQVGAAVQHMRSSSTELQTAANQQATGAKEQASAMSEITTTIHELLATSRQIAESAQSVSRIADDTSKAAKAGERTLAKGGESIQAIKKQVDLIVTQMLDLGRKSQQIGGILDMTSELAEQTNILAINATIEAAGAGEHGKRFGVVADEIRKLADRVGASTKEIRPLVDDIRAAVNATVMTTEGGSKAVEVGTRQFVDAAVAIEQIVRSVSTTTEAAREIELSTKQQATAVEQVNVAVASVAQTTRETEASATQTLQTASEIAALSKDLMRIVRPTAA